jgi:hypothetical protein
VWEEDETARMPWRLFGKEDMMLSDKDQRHIAVRRKLIRSWKWVGPVFLTVVSGTVVFLFLRYPIVFNPFYVIDGLKKGRLCYSTIQTLAVFCSVGFLIIEFLLVIFILLLVASMSNERKLLDLIDKK